MEHVGLALKRFGFRTIMLSFVVPMLTMIEVLGQPASELQAVYPCEGIAAQTVTLDPVGFTSDRVHFDEAAFYSESFSLEFWLKPIGNKATVSFEGHLDNWLVFHDEGTPTVVSSLGYLIVIASSDPDNKDIFYPNDDANNNDSLSKRFSDANGEFFHVNSPLSENYTFGAPLYTYSTVASDSTLTSETWLWGTWQRYALVFNRFSPDGPTYSVEVFMNLAGQSRDSTATDHYPIRLWSSTEMMFHSWLVMGLENVAVKFALGTTSSTESVSHSYAWLDNIEFFSGARSQLDIATTFAGQVRDPGAVVGVYFDDYPLISSQPRDGVSYNTSGPTVAISFEGIDGEDFYLNEVLWGGTTVQCGGLLLPAANPKEARPFCYFRQSDSTYTVRNAFFDPTVDVQSIVMLGQERITEMQECETLPKIPLYGGCFREDSEWFDYDHWTVFSAITQWNTEHDMCYFEAVTRGLPGYFVGSNGVCVLLTWKGFRQVQTVSPTLTGLTVDVNEKSDGVCVPDTSNHLVFPSAQVSNVAIGEIDAIEEIDSLALYWLYHPDCEPRWIAASELQLGPIEVSTWRSRVLDVASDLHDPRKWEVADSAGNHIDQLDKSGTDQYGRLMFVPNPDRDPNLPTASDDLAEISIFTHIHVLRETEIEGFFVSVFNRFSYELPSKNYTSTASATAGFTVLSGETTVVQLECNVSPTVTDYYIYIDSQTARGDHVMTAMVLEGFTDGSISVTSEHGWTGASLDLTYHCRPIDGSFAVIVDSCTGPSGLPVDCPISTTITAVSDDADLGERSVFGEEDTEISFSLLALGMISLPTPPVVARVSNLPSFGTLWRVTSSDCVEREEITEEHVGTAASELLGDCHPSSAGSSECTCGLVYLGEENFNSDSGVQDSIGVLLTDATGVEASLTIKVAVSNVLDRPILQIPSKVGVEGCPLVLDIRAMIVDPLEGQNVVSFEVESQTGTFFELFGGAGGCPFPPNLHEFPSWCPSLPRPYCFDSTSSSHQFFRPIGEDLELLYIPLLEVSEASYSVVADYAGKQSSGEGAILVTLISDAPQIFTTSYDVYEDGGMQLACLMAADKDGVSFSSALTIGIDSTDAPVELHSYSEGTDEFKILTLPSILPKISNLSTTVANVSLSNLCNTTDIADLSIAIFGVTPTAEMVGSYLLTLRASDEGGLETVAQASLNLIPMHDSPTLVETGDLELEGTMNSQLTFNVLVNDNDIDCCGDSVELDLATPPKRGSLQITSQSVSENTASFAITYTPNEYEGSPIGERFDTFELYAVDSTGLESDAPRLVEIFISCHPGTFAMPDGECRRCEAGMFSSILHAPQCTPCLRGTVSAEEEASECEFCDFGTFQDSQGQTSCENCGVNTVTLERASSNATDCVCAEGYYGDGLTCIQCGVGMVCEVGNNTQPQAEAGFWVGESPGTGEIVALNCIPAEACSGGEESEVCNDGYEGIRCASCTFGFYKSGDNCLACDDDDGGWIYVALFILLGVSAPTILLRTGGPTSVRLFVPFSIGLQFFQFTAVIANYNLKWPSWLSDFMQFFTFFNINIQLVRPECKTDIEWTFYHTWFCTILTPVMISAFAWIYFWGGVIQRKLVLRFREKKSIEPVRRECGRWSPTRVVNSVRMSLWRVMNIPNTQEQLFWRKLKVIRAHLIVITLGYLFLVQTTLRFFACEPNVDGNKYLVAEPTEICSLDVNGNWSKFFGFAVFFTLLYVVGIPLLLTFCLYRYRFDMDNESIHYVFGYLTIKYEMEFYWWEVVLMLRKLAIAVSSLFWSTELIKQSLIGLLVLFLSFLSTIVVNPFRANLHDILEAVGLMTNFGVLLSGVLLINPDMPDELATTVGVIDLLLLIGSVVCVIVVIVADTIPQTRMMYTQSKIKKNMAAASVRHLAVHNVMERFAWLFKESAMQHMMTSEIMEEENVVTKFQDITDELEKFHFRKNWCHMRNLRSLVSATVKDDMTTTVWQFLATRRKVDSVVDHNTIAASPMMRAGRPYACVTFPLLDASTGGVGHCVPDSVWVKLSLGDGSDTPLQKVSVPPHLLDHVAVLLEYLRKECEETKGDLLEVPAARLVERQSDPDLFLDVLASICKEKEKSNFGKVAKKTIDYRFFDHLEEDLELRKTLSSSSLFNRGVAESECDGSERDGSEYDGSESSTEDQTSNNWSSDEDAGSSSAV